MHPRRRPLYLIFAAVSGLIAISATDVLAVVGRAATPVSYDVLAVVGRPATPVSYAGVARRSVRRAPY
jgi:hypothetical protein